MLILCCFCTLVAYRYIVAICSYPYYAVLSNQCRRISGSVTSRDRLTPASCWAGMATSIHGHLLCATYASWS